VRTLILLAVVAVSIAVAGAASGRPVTKNCGEARAQSWNGNQVFVPGTGPQCLYRAYRAHCAATSFRLRMMGVDTLGTLEFRVVKPANGCRVQIVGKNTVYVGHPRTTTWHETCRTVAKQANGIAVKGCNGKAGDYLLSPLQP
jgi:hypothetical protein